MIIPLTRGCTTIIDDEDYEKISRWKWCVLNDRRKKFYACAFVNGKKTLLHRFLINAPHGSVVDHINGDPLDNRKANLRITTNMQNCWNRESPRIKKTSKFKGVCYCKERRGNKKWRASIVVAGKQIRLGLYDNELEAARAYNEAALKYHGPYAKLNSL